MLKVTNNIRIGEINSLHLYDDWSIFLNRFNYTDIYYSKNYVSLFAKIQKGRPEAVYFENEKGKIFYPFIKRNIELNKEYFDIITPYGYGGPLLEGDPTVMKLFYEQFKEYALKNKIVSETVGFHPLLNNKKYFEGLMSMDLIRETTAVDLTLPLEEIRNNYPPQNKRNINKARKEGIEIIQTTKNDDLNDFIKIYYETMNRNQASSFYYFPSSYFYQQMQETDQSNTILLLAKYKNETIAGVMLIYGKTFAHYHLGASKKKYIHLRPNNLLFDTMIECSKSLGLRSLHLGGGYADGDGLFTFKTAFTNQNNFQYYLGKNIINDEVYKVLIRKSNEKDLNSSNKKFFPAYRKSQ